MKLSCVSPHTCISILAASAAIVAPLQADVTDAQGRITTDRGLVLPNSVVTVDWEASYPSNPVVREPSGTLVTSEEVTVSVRVVGAAFGPTNRPYPVRGWVTTSAQSGWTEIFFGNSDTYNPQAVVWTKVLAAGETLDFKFQGAETSNYELSDFSSINRWRDAIDTTATSVRPWNLAVLVDGETSPNYNPAFDQADVHSHLSSYFLPNTTTLNLGERDFIYLTELSEHRLAHPGTDMQDLVFLVTYETTESSERVADEEGD